MTQVARNLIDVDDGFLRGKRYSIKTECLSRMIFFGQASLRHAIRQFMTHYHTERNHQGLGNRLLHPELATAPSRHTVQRHQRLGGMLNYYHRSAA